MKIFLTALLVLMFLPNVAGAQERNFSASVNEFCWKFFGTLERNENAVFSPYGIHAALSLLSNGATGETQAELLRALSVDDLDALNGGHKNFSAYAAKTYDKTFAEANMFLIDKKVGGRGLDKNFKLTADDVYKAYLREADFAGNLAGERKKITRFVDDKTRGLIPDYRPLVDENTLTDLLNVVYFSGDWQFPFDPRRTQREDFTNCDGTKFSIDMMNKTFDEEISYRADENFCGIKLPYTTGAAMYLILPTDENALNVTELWNAQSVEYLENFLDALKTSPPFDGKVVVSMPNTSFDYESFIVQNLMALGIRKAFTSDAEFFNVINDTQLKISAANHRATINVDERGTKAAAVTEISMLEGTAPGFNHPPQVVYFHANRPYIFVIRDIETSMTLFVGAVNKF